MLTPYIQFFANGSVSLTLKMLYYAAYVMVPGGLLLILWELWIDWRRAIYNATQNYILLEIKVPKDVFKSPRAAEFFITAIWKRDYERNWHEKYWMGQTRQDYSLEIAGIDGSVHFFIRTRKSLKNLIEANLYSQYPGIEVFEVPDYTLGVNFDPKVYGLNAFEFDLLKPDAYPIKTYIDYGMDKDPEEEYKIDPLTPLIEFMGSLGRGHQAWCQILIRAHKPLDKDPKGGKKLVDLKWREGAEIEIEKILKKIKQEIGPDGKPIPGTGRFLHDVESETIKALGRSVGKNGFDCGIRVLYTAPRDVYVSSNIAGLIGGIIHFNSPYNGFAPVRASDDINLFWKKFGFAIPRNEKVRNKERQEMLDAYKRRMYFYRPHKRPHFVLNTEELATLFHFPGAVSYTPTFSRIDSRKAEAPANLPV